MVDNKKVIGKIKKLLAMSKDSSSPHEAAIAAERARKLMDKHQLDYDDIEFHDDDFAEIHSGKIVKRMPLWKQSLAISVAKLNDCNARIKFFDGGRRAVKFQGFVADVQLCDYLYNYLIAAGESQCKAFFKQRGAIDRTLKTNWLAGFGWAIRDRIDEIAEERAKLKTLSGRDLVVVKGALVKQHFGAAKYSTTTHKSDYNDPEVLAAIRAGKKAGEQTTIHHGIAQAGESQQALGFGG